MNCRSIGLSWAVELDCCYLSPVTHSRVDTLYRSTTARGKDSFKEVSTLFLGRKQHLECTGQVERVDWVWGGVE